MDFKQRSLKVLAAFAIYLTLDVIFGKLMQGSNSFLLLKTILGLALIAVVGELLMKVQGGAGERNRNAAPPGVVLKEGFEIKAITTVMATPHEVLSTLKDPASRKIWDTGC